MSANSRLELFYIIKLFILFYIIIIHTIIIIYIYYFSRLLVNKSRIKTYLERFPCSRSPKARMAAPWESCPTSWAPPWAPPLPSSPAGAATTPKPTPVSARGSSATSAISSTLGQFVTLYTQRIIFEILFNHTKIRLHLAYSDWFETKRRSVLFQINRNMVNTIWLRFDSIRFRKTFSVCTRIKNWFLNLVKLDLIRIL